MSATFALPGGQLAALFLILMRTTGLVVAAPILSHRAIPGIVKAGLAATLAISLVGHAEVAPQPAPLIIAAIIEVLIGLCIGFMLSLTFHAIEIVGRLLAIQMGFSLGAVFSPTSSEGSTALDPLFAVLGGLLFLALNLHLAVVETLASSLTVLPIGGAWPSNLFLLATRLTAVTLELGVRLAMPLAMVLLITELAVALVARAVPQLNVFIMGLPLKIMAGVAVTSIALPGLASATVGVFRFIFQTTRSLVMP